MDDDIWNSHEIGYSVVILFKLDYVQSTLVIPNSKGLSETLRGIGTSKYKSCGGEKNNKSNNHI